MLPPLKTADDMSKQRSLITHTPITAKRRAEAAPARAEQDEKDEFGDAGIDDNDLAMAESGGFANIDDFDKETSIGTNPRGKAKPKHKARKASNQAAAAQDWEPRKLDNGKWACNHACKDKTACKHLCCREGLDKKPKPPKAKEVKKADHSGSDPKQTQLNMPTKKNYKLSAPATSGQTPKPPVSSAKKSASDPEIQNLERLHNSAKSNTCTVPLPVSYTHLTMPTKRIV